MPNSTPQTRNPATTILLRRCLPACLLLVLISGCGLKGDLTLEPQTPADTPAQTETDSDDDDA